MPTDETKIEDTRCGFLTLLGAPNAGKSTLVNQLIGQKVSIVSPKVQTTRTRVSAVLTEGNCQAVFIDTPGIFADPKRRLEKAMISMAWQEAHQTDRIMVLVDASKKAAIAHSEIILSNLKGPFSKIDLILNKVDAVPKEQLLGLADRLMSDYGFAACFMVSALKGSGVDQLRNHVFSLLPEGPWHYPEDQITDLSNPLLAAEVTREKLFLNLNQELPYELTVETENWTIQKNGDLRIEQAVFVSKSGHKGIVLGNKGQKIKKVGAEARRDLSELFGRKVHLFIFVKVKENWLDDMERYREMGIDPSVVPR
jgi:GTPase